MNADRTAARRRSDQPDLIALRLRADRENTTKNERTNRMLPSPEAARTQSAT